MIIDFFNEISFYQSIELIELSKDQIRRHLRKNRHREQTLYKYETINNIKTILLNYKYIDEFKRIREPKKNQIRKKLKKQKYIGNEKIEYNIDLCINFHDNLDYEYYENIVKLIKLMTNAPICYVIEKDSQNYNHLHLMINYPFNKFYIILEKIIEEYLNRKMDFLDFYKYSKKTSIFFIEIPDIEILNIKKDYFCKQKSLIYL